MVTIEITSTNPATYEVRVSSFDCDVFALVINDLKVRIPPSLRNYNPTWKRWYIKRQALPYLCEWVRLAQDTFNATVEGDQGPRCTGEWTPPRPGNPDWVDTDSGAYAALHLLPSAPPQLVKIAYRELAKIHHPDHGGDVRQMQKLNDAFETLKPRLAA